MSHVPKESERHALQNKSDAPASTATAVPSSWAWTTRDWVVASAVSIVFGLLYLVWVQVWGVANALLGPFGLDVIFGFWYVAGFIVPYIVRKPGAALFGETVAATAELLAGSPSGIRLVLSGLIQGTAPELTLAVRRYRSYSGLTLAVGGLATGFVSFWYEAFLFGYFDLSPGIFIGRMVVRMLSGAVLGGLTGKYLGDALARTGVLQAFPIGKAYQKRV